ncbi:MAG: hypothetical protein HC872_09460 [Gammaproteobacteria bacterium]|nr:hypothetical protein [Gammaproteobacteria bacterium]
MNTAFANAERVMASVAGLALFTLNEVRMFHGLPRSPDAATGHVYGASMQLLGATEPVYLSALDVASRWGLTGLTVGLCLWAVAETIGKKAQLAE